VIAPRSLGWRLSAWMFAAMSALAGLLALYTQRQTHELVKRESDERLATLARHVAAASLLGALAQSEELLAGPLDGAMSQPDVEGVAIYDAGGGLIAARSRRGAPTPAWASDATGCRPCALGGGRVRWVAPVLSGTSARTTDEAGFFEGPPRPAAPGPSMAGWLVLDVSTAARTAAERQITTRGLLIAGAALLLALAATLLVAQRVTSPLRQLAEATREIGKGRWDAPLPRAATTEIAQLAADFHAMTAALADLDRENRRYREHLEEMVASRTRELEEAYQHVKAMADAKGQFVATVSHDFRSPLAIVLSAIQTVQADPGMRDDVRRSFLTRAERHCKRLGALVNDLLDLARIENRDGAFERVDLAGVIEEALEGARAAAEDRRVALACDASAEPVLAEVDRGHVVRAVANLVDNALKFTPPAGRVTVGLRCADGVACIAVSDTGPGIPDEEREHLFERFYQGRRGRELGSGSGLGLAIVAGVARQHGGRVEVTSALGAGSTFVLRLPLARR
jgi:signal transduction histidine kinase